MRMSMRSIFSMKPASDAISILISSHREAKKQFISRIEGYHFTD
jgi:hypothetical protein